jgi:hypothetical protein
VQFQRLYRKEIIMESAAITFGGRLRAIKPWIEQGCPDMYLRFDSTVLQCELDALCKEHNKLNPLLPIANSMGEIVPCFDVLNTYVKEIEVI